MANEDIARFFPHHEPVTRATVPTGDGLFPLHQRAQAGRKRRPMLDLRLHDAQVRMDGTVNLLDFGWAIIAQAYGGDWSTAPENWRQAAEAFKGRYFAEMGQVPGAQVGDPIILGAHQERQLESIRSASAGAHAPAPVETEAEVPKETLAAFLARLAAVPPTVAMNELPAWDGRDETFQESATNRWNELNPVKGPTPVVILTPPPVETPTPPPVQVHTGGPIPQDGPRSEERPTSETVLVLDQPDATGVRPIARPRDPEEDAETSNLGLGSEAPKERAPAPVTVAVHVDAIQPLAGDALEKVKEELANATDSADLPKATDVSVESLDLTPPDKTEERVEGTAPPVENPESGSRGETLEGQGKADVEGPANPQSTSTPDPDPAPAAQTFVPPPPNPKKKRPQGPNK